MPSLGTGLPFPDGRAIDPKQSQCRRVSGVMQWLLKTSPGGLQPFSDTGVMSGPPSPFRPGQLPSVMGCPAAGAHDPPKGGSRTIPGERFIGDMSAMDVNKTTAEDRTPPAERLDDHLTLYPHLVDRILRQILIELHERGAVSIDQVYDEARAAAGNEERSAGNPNVAEAPRGDQRERDLVNALTRKYAAQYFSAHEIDEIVNLALKREEADKLRAIVSLGSVSFRLLCDTVKRFCSLPEGETQLAPDEAMGVRVGLIRHLISDQLEFIAVAKKYLRIRDFEEIIQRIIGAEAGMGRIGGKAAGMFLASRILLGPKVRPYSDSSRPAEPATPAAGPPPVTDASVVIPESYYLRSDVIEDFIAFNGLGEYQNQKYKSSEDIRKEYPLIKSVFRNAEFPSGIVDRLRGVLQRLGDSPLIVRSSSLLEDRFGTAFSGKYASIFVANQGSFEKRLKALLGAIAEVFASALGPDPLLYRRENDLIDYDEDMAVLIQRVVGSRFGNYFAPSFAGVAFSRNEYRWSPRIKREDGLMRIVAGLGTRAVDRIGAEFPRMVALGMPTLRHESSVAEIKTRAQRTLDVINLAKNRLETISLDMVLEHAADFPMLDRIVSIDSDGMLTPPMGTFIDAKPSQLYITFDKLMSEGSFPAQMKNLLRKLELAYGVPVDVEFAHDGTQLYLLQCRTLSQREDAGHVPIPADVPEERTIFTAQKFIRSGLVENVEFIVYVDGRAYDALPTRVKRTAVARLIGRLNEKLSGRNFILMGPGRWGSNDIRLGVPVSYADISKSRMLIEVAYERDGYVPEVSYGTHFFQDLVEAGILYLPLYPNDRRNRFNETFLHDSPSSLTELVPDAADMVEIVRVIDVPAVSGGKSLRIVMNGDEDKALAYLADDGGR